MLPFAPCSILVPSPLKRSAVQLVSTALTISLYPARYHAAFERLSRVGTKWLIAMEDEAERLFKGFAAISPFSRLVYHPLERHMSRAVQTRAACNELVPA